MTKGKAEVKDNGEKITAVLVVTDLQRLVAGALIAKYTYPSILWLTKSQSLDVDIRTLIHEKPNVNSIILAGVKMTAKNAAKLARFIKEQPDIKIKWYVKQDHLEQENITGHNLGNVVTVYSGPDEANKGKFRDVIKRDFKVTDEDYKEYSKLFDYFGDKDAAVIKSEVIECCSESSGKKSCSENIAMWWLMLQWAIQKQRAFHKDDAVTEEIKEMWGNKIPETKKEWLKKNAAILDGRIMGTSPETLAILRKIDRLAGFTAVPVIIYGPTGTGKELLSSLLHLRSARKGRFISINCAGLPADIMESILFGVKGGVYTGVDKDKEGLVEEAAEGTIFLDEIAEMPMIVQAKLLRFIQFKTFRRMGCNEIRTVDARIIAATNTDLRAKVKKGEFREDLLYRLAGEEIVIPPLKKRKDDIDDIANRYYMEFCLQNGKKSRFLTDAEIEQLKKYDWPGNIRQLQRVIRKAVMYDDYNFTRILKEEDNINKYGIYQDNAAAPDTVPQPEEEDLNLDAIEKRCILKAYEKYKGKISDMEKALGVSKNTVKDKLTEYGVDYKKKA